MVRTITPKSMRIMLAMVTVFDIPEVLEIILWEVPTIGLLGLQRANKDLAQQHPSVSEAANQIIFQDRYLAVLLA